MAWSNMISSKPTTCLRTATWRRSRQHCSHSPAWWVLEMNAGTGNNVIPTSLHYYNSILLLFPWQPSTLISLRPRPRAASHGWTLGWSTLTSRRGCLMRRRWRLDSASSAYRYSLFWRLLSEQQGLKWEESQKFSFGSTTLLNCASILHNMSHSLFICNFKLDSWPLFTVSISHKWSLWWYRSESDTQSCGY